MSTCPERELLCVYVDGELPEKYRTKLETHIAGCESCRRHLTQLQTIQTAMYADARSLSFSDTALNESFSRLKTKQSYRKVALVPDHRNNAGWYGFGAMAAVAVLAILLPLQMNRTGPIPVIPRIEPITKNTLIHPAAPTASMASFASYDTKTSEKSAVTVNLTGESLATIDIFRPDLPEKAITITINLETVPVILPDDAKYWQQTGGIPVSFAAADIQ